MKDVISKLLVLGLCASCGSHEEPDVLWRFEHVIIDDAPPATYRINDIHVGDIDGDGLPDIWTSGRGAGPEAYQQAWYKNPDWTRYRVSPGDYKYGALGDIDNDGDLDIVVGQSWFENSGNLERKDWPEYPLGYDFEPDLVLVGDLNADQRLDIVVNNKRELYWLPGPTDPRKSWHSYLIYGESSNRTGGTLADIDGDGDLDILWGNAWFENPPDPSRVPWDRHIIDSAWPAEARGAVGDLDGDGRLEIVLSAEESDEGIAWYAAPDDVRLGEWTGNSIVDRKFEGIHSLALADFDQDGDLDVFAAEMHHGADPDKVAVFENVQIKTNKWVEHIIATSGSHNATVADIDGDGLPDIVGKNYQAGEFPLRVDLWMNKIVRVLPMTKWERHIIDDARPWKALFIDAGDVNGDGLPDIVTGGWWYENPGSLSETWIRHAIGDEFYNMAVLHDLDGDKDLDVFGTKGKIHSSTLVWAENDGRGRFSVHDNIPNGDGDFLQGSRVGQIVPGGNPEILLSWHNYTSTQMLRIPVPATEFWSWEVISPATNGEQISIGDIDRDGDLDVHFGTFWLRADHQSWTKIDVIELSTPGAAVDRVELADIDGDGDLDVVIGCEHAKCVVWGEAPRDPNDVWTEHLISLDIQAMSLDVGDIDGDGDVDIIVGEHNTTDPSQGRVIIYQNEGQGRRWRTYEIDSGLEHHDGTRLVDLDLDGDLDVISIGFTHEMVVVYENKAVD